MKQLYILLLYFSLISALQKGEKCRCAQLMTEKECQKSNTCAWDNFNMICNPSNTLITQKYLLENLEETKPTKARSYHCSAFKQNNCSQEHPCIWFNEKCTHFTGCTAYLRSSHSDCQDLSTRCISNGNNCVEISDCNTYKNEFSCFKNHFNQYCYWNKIKKSCSLPNTCEEIPKLIQSHQDCQEQMSQCTAKEGGGCQQKNYHCSDYKEELSCVININSSKECFWLYNQCYEKNCENAPLQLRTDKDCNEFFEGCTTKLNGGCAKKSKCSDYQISDACVSDMYGESCLWNGTQCLDSTCDNAPETYTTNEQCQQIHQICMTNGKGCTYNFGCAFAKDEQYCIRDGDGKECFWNGNSCTLKNCSLANESIVGNDACTKFMSTCTSKPDGQGGCVEKTCQNAPTNITSNDECKTYLPSGNCIIKQGGGCQGNKICAYIETEEGCKIDIFGNQCQWNEIESKCSKITVCSSIKAEKDCSIDSHRKECVWINLDKKEKRQCAQKSCQTAPLTIKSEQECENYFIPSDGTTCTNQKGGGCRTKTTCKDASSYESCTTDSNKNQCFWESNQCRIRECRDLVAKTYLECNSFDNRCTLGMNEKCDTMMTCESYTQKMQCIKGTDGPCLWIDNYKNKGACFLYNECSSFHWTTDAECKMISNYCTTNGFRCVPLTSCRETNTSGGCVTGTDGDCIQLIPQVKSIEPEFCEIFIQCSQAYYLTHEECQRANSQCTTNGETGCTGLSSCENYIKESCHFNHIGVITNDKNLIVSTGKCVWDSNQCRNQQCSDLNYEDKNECTNALSQCTSDGTKCIDKLMCSEYDNSVLCNYAIGIEGPCVWGEEKCKQSKCKDIQNGITTEICSIVENCVSDGTICMEKKKCSDYKTQVSCNSLGLDGLCFWTEQFGQCALMDGCRAASNDKIACQQASDRCQWISNGNQSQCIEHTCQTYENYMGECQYFLSWDWQQYNICRFVSQKCMAFEVKTLQEDSCYIYSLQLYRWNPISNSCTECDTDAYRLHREKIPEENGITVVLICEILSAIIFIIIIS